MPATLQENLVRLRSPSWLAEAVHQPSAFLSGDRGNIRRLAEHIDCSVEDAAELYRLARRDGYPSAYRSVFGSSPDGRRRRLGAMPRWISAQLATPPSGTPAPRGRAR
jgi:hypothetical protein